MTLNQGNKSVIYSFHSVKLVHGMMGDGNSVDWAPESCHTLWLMFSRAYPFPATSWGKSLCTHVFRWEKKKKKTEEI